MRPDPVATCAQRPDLGPGEEARCTDVIRGHKEVSTPPAGLESVCNVLRRAAPAVVECERDRGLCPRPAVVAKQPDRPWRSDARNRPTVLREFTMVQLVA